MCILTLALVTALAIASTVGPTNLKPAAGSRQLPLFRQLQKSFPQPYPVKKRQYY